jgi:hypothetical protein
LRAEHRKTDLLKLFNCDHKITVYVFVILTISVEKNDNGLLWQKSPK